MNENTQSLLAEVERQTTEINHHRQQVAELGKQRRELFAALKQEGVTYKTLAAATGLHTMTIQQDMKRWRNENPRELWESFTRATAGLPKSATTGTPCDTDSKDSDQDAVALPA
jgi:DNA-directed RNA polymerase specialized sigma24 family protein|tara:strand:+ start:62 stop:403 length:342 start_codon:yes stop_codon:yes gene_type:complete